LPSSGLISRTRTRSAIHSSWGKSAGIEAQFQALRYFTLDGTDHTSHEEQARMIRRYLGWRNRHADDAELREVVDRAKAGG